MIYEKLMNIQQELKAPKNQYNSFGKYNYRNLEDIEEALKPLLLKYKCCLVIEDDVVAVGDRVYVKATAILFGIEDGADFIKSTAFAREALTQKGMNDAQITGSSSSYARKYCVSGLFLIDDTKDPDSNEDNPEPKKKTTKPKVALMTEAQKTTFKNKIQEIEPLAENKEFYVVANALGISNETTTEKEFKDIWAKEEKAKFKTLEDLLLV